MPTDHLRFALTTTTEWGEGNPTVFQVRNNMGYAIHSHSTHSRMSPIFSNDATYDHIRHFDVLNHGRGCQPLSDVAVTDGDGGHEAGDNQEAPQEPGQTWRRTLIGHFGGTSVKDWDVEKCLLHVYLFYLFEVCYLRAIFRPRLQ